MKATPSIVFLIPFAPRKIKVKWDTACAQLRQTLASIRNSTSGNFAVVVAGHEAPDFMVETDDRFRFLSLQHPLPEHPSRGVVVRLDKLTKISAAWEYAKANWNSQYVMKLDADDLISSRLVNWVDTADNAPGYLIEQGWIWQSEAIIIRPQGVFPSVYHCEFGASSPAPQRGGRVAGHF